MERSIGVHDGANAIGASGMMMQLQWLATIRHDVQCQQLAGMMMQMHWPKMMTYKYSAQ